jgi:hypothetical protein
VSDAQRHKLAADLENLIRIFNPVAVKRLHIGLNQGYGHWIEREELFERERGSDPDFQV